jgi:hypothetical protein
MVPLRKMLRRIFDETGDEDKKIQTMDGLETYKWYPCPD